MVAGTLCAAAAVVSCGGQSGDAGQIQDVTKTFASALKDIWKIDADSGAGG
jgi:hypothetical protein